jgi:hypothetical protein
VERHDSLLRSWPITGHAIGPPAELVRLVDEADEVVVEPPDHLGPLSETQITDLDGKSLETACRMTPGLDRARCLKQRYEDIQAHGGVIVAARLTRRQYKDAIDQELASENADYEPEYYVSKCILMLRVAARPSETWYIDRSAECPGSVDTRDPGLLEESWTQEAQAEWDRRAGWDPDSFAGRQGQLTPRFT